MVSHYEDRLVDVYALVSSKPKLKKADPSSRTGCKSTGILFGAPTVVTCQNATMAQFVEALNRDIWIAGGAEGRRVVDDTGIQGTWDLSFAYRVRPAPEPAPGVASEPTGDLSPFEAIEQQLGLKLQKAKRPVPVFVIDHIEENPTEN